MALYRRLKTDLRIKNLKDGGYIEHGEVIERLVRHMNEFAEKYGPEHFERVEETEEAE